MNCHSCDKILNSSSNFISSGNIKFCSTDCQIAFKEHNHTNNHSNRKILTMEQYFQIRNSILKNTQQK